MSNLRGFFTIAQGDDYLRMAYALALSLKVSQRRHNELTVGVTPGANVPIKYKAVFNAVEIPWMDHAANSKWKLENEWKAIYMTPYDHTIKLDADMLFTRDISHWWSILAESDGVFATNVHTYRNQLVTNDAYRELFVENDLPNIYTALFSFQRTEATFELFKVAEDIFNNWQRYYLEFLEPNTRPTYVSTDVVFAIACKITGFHHLNKTPHFELPTFVHMKTKLQGWQSTNVEDWLQLVPTYYTPDCELKVGNYLQTLPFHYYRKEFLTDEMIKTLEKKVGV